jgi:hypothetical protein
MFCLRRSNFIKEIPEIPGQPVTTKPGTVCKQGGVRAGGTSRFMRLRAVLDHLVFGPDFFLIPSMYRIHQQYI